MVYFRGYVSFREGIFANDGNLGQCFAKLMSGNHVTFPWCSDVKQLESWLWHLWYYVESIWISDLYKNILSHNYTYIESSRILLQYVYHCLLKKADPNHPNIPILRLHAMPCQVKLWNTSWVGVGFMRDPPHFCWPEKTSRTSVFDWSVRKDRAGNFRVDHRRLKDSISCHLLWKGLLPSELIIIDSLVGELVISFRKGWETMGLQNLDKMNCCIDFWTFDLLLWWSAGKAL